MKKLQKLSVLFSTALVLGSSVNFAAIAEAADYNLPDARFEVDPSTPSWEKDKEHPAKLRWYVNFDWYA
ncbi:MAG: ABC transporter, partial [Globicatella sulfidifaciens]|nr:ABC transporter [Globicatella sulfidifaciens]